MGIYVWKDAATLHKSQKSFERATRFVEDVVNHQSLLSALNVIVHIIKKSLLGNKMKNYVLKVNSEPEAFTHRLHEELLLFFVSVIRKKIVFVHWDPTMAVEPDEWI